MEALPSRTPVSVRIVRNVNRMKGWEARKRVNESEKKEREKKKKEKREKNTEEVERARD